jgi:hypothetical protein
MKHDEIIEYLSVLEQRRMTEQGGVMGEQQKVLICMGMVDGCIRLLSMFLFGVMVTEKQ